jgi:2-polyprenyl-3-methyl-5-hydroxy-6-metoxy-1,4-benzoquinol methylase
MRMPQPNKDVMSHQRHNYEYDVDTMSTTAPAYVVGMVGNHKRVLELGCGPGSITRILSERNHCQVTGVEIDTSAIQIVEPYCESVIQADLNSDAWPLLLDDLGQFDVVVAADVLEHLYDPWAALGKMVAFINQHNGYLVISIPHVGHASIMACLLKRRFRVS